MFEDTKGVIKRRNSKEDKQYNDTMNNRKGQNKRNVRHNTTKKTKY